MFDPPANLEHGLLVSVHCLDADTKSARKTGRNLHIPRPNTAGCFSIKGDGRRASCERVREHSQIH
jgi:hypothetical protein